MRDTILVAVAIVAVVSLAIVSPHDDTTSLVTPARGCLSLALVDAMVSDAAGLPDGCRVIYPHERIRVVNRLPWKRRVQIDIGGELLWLAAETTFPPL